MVFLAPAHDRVALPIAPLERRYGRARAPHEGRNAIDGAYWIDRQ